MAVEMSLEAHVQEGSFFKSKVPLGKLIWFLFSWATEILLHHVTWQLTLSPRMPWTGVISTQID